MNANFFALGMACVIFGLYNMIFVGGFFKTAFKLGRPFVIFIIACFLVIFTAESLHHIAWNHRAGMTVKHMCSAKLKKAVRRVIALAGLLFFDSCGGNRVEIASKG